jgi:cell division protein FtsQ
MSRMKAAPRQAPLRQTLSPPVRPLQDRPGRWKLLLKRQRRKLRPAAASIALIGTLGLLAVLLHSLGTGASLHERFGSATASLGFRVRNIVIEGRQKTPEPELRAAIGVRPGEPLLTWSVEAARLQIQKIKWVQSAAVERRLPDTVVVQLIERRPFAIWQHNGNFSLIDRAGELVTDTDTGNFAGQLPLVVGTGAPKYAAILLDLLATMPSLQSHMVAAVRVGERRWNLRMTNGADVLLPEGAEAPALARLAELQASQGLLDRPLMVVDLRLPDRLVLRPAADPAHQDSKSAPPTPRKPT